MRNDPAQREKERVRNRKYNAKRRQSPEYRERMKKYHAEWVAGLSEEQKQDQLATKKAWRDRNNARILLRQRELAHEYRLQVIRHYSNGTMSCACCGESHEQFLAIDHVNGGGGKHRKEIGKGGDKFVRWLLRNNLPDGYQILCHNCNCSRGYYGYCPHDKQSRLIKGGKK